MATSGRRCEIAQLFFANQVNSIYREALQTVEIEQPYIISFTNGLDTRMTQFKVKPIHRDKLNIPN